MRGKGLDGPRLRLSERGSKFWRRWRNGLSFWPTTAGYVKAATASRRSPLMLVLPWRGGLSICTTPKLGFNFGLLHIPVFLFLVCRYDSLNNLDTLYPNLAAMFSCPRPHSAAGGFVIPSRNAASRYSTGSMSSQRNVYMDSSHFARYTIHVY